MPRKSSSIRAPKKSGDQKPHSWSDLDQLGVGRDHYYRRYLELARQQCPRCGWHHISQRRCVLGVTRGWEWRCHECTQTWRTPNITPGMKRSRQDSTMITACDINISVIAGHGDDEKSK